MTTGVSPAFLAHERELAQQGKVTPDCTFERCAACGACPTLDARNELARPRVSGGSNAHDQQSYAERTGGAPLPMTAQEMEEYHGRS